MNIAFVGCGFVADFYINTLANHPELKLLGVTDRVPERVKRFSSYYKIPSYENLDNLLEDVRIDIVVNLTNPRSHYNVTKQSLLAGKHVYSEKPLSMVYDEASELVELAKKKKLYLGGAPCSVLGEAAQTLWKAIRDRMIGDVHLVYAELDDGMIHKMRYKKWSSESGSPWPAKDEFEVGCTFEHAGYYVTWLLAFFGPVKSVTSFASCLIKDKKTDEQLDTISPDISVACLEFESGVVARLTCSIIAPHNHSIQIIGESGILTLDECWNYGEKVYLKRTTPWSLRLEKFPILSRLLGFGPQKVPIVKNAKLKHTSGSNNQMDFSRGISEMANAIKEKRKSRLSGEFSLHVNEVVFAIQNVASMGTPYRMRSTFHPMTPMPWGV